MSKFLDTILCRETHRFSLLKYEKDRINNKLEKILATKGYSINLCGKIKNENEFKLTDKYTIGIYIQGGGDPAYLKGRFSEEADRAILTIRVNSHLCFPITTISIFLFLIPILFFISFENEADRYWVPIFLLIVGFTLNAAGNFFKKRLLNKTLRELGLKK